MAVTTPTRPKNERLRENYHWTPRQREVLEMLVKGYTNGRIAEALGISLDGAKWHISEIISKLGVDSREEAAEYWRAYNGMSLRFSRLFRAIFTGAAAKVAMGGVGLAVVVGVGVLVAVTLWQRAEDNAADESPPVTATVEVPTPSASATPDTTAPGTGEVIDGVPVRALSLGSDAAVPENVALYYSTMCYACGPLEPPAYRAYTDASGRLHVDELFVALKAQYGRNPYTWAASPSFGEIVATMCTQGYCGGEAMPSADAKAKVVRSVDGGVTWSEVRDIPANTFAHEVVPGAGALMTSYQETNGVGSSRFWMLESGQDIEAPAQAGNAWPIAVSGLGLVWQAESGILFDASGDAVFTPRHFAPNRPESPIGESPDGLVYTVWTKPRAAQPDPQTFYIGKYDTNGTLQNVYAWTGRESFRPKQVLNATTVLGDILLSGTPTTGTNRMFAYEAAIIDLKTGTIHPLRQLSEPLRDNSNPFIDGYAVGPFARVNAVGDCLNVREQPDTGAKSIACYKDGVLLKDRGETQQAGGVTWLAVTTPSGKDGWASLEFLER